MASFAGHLKRGCLAYPQKKHLELEGTALTVLLSASEDVFSQSTAAVAPHGVETVW